MLRTLALKTCFTAVKYQQELLVVSLCVQSFKTVLFEQQFIKMQLGFSQGCAISSPTDSSSSSSSKSNSSETQQISRSSSRLGQSPKTRLQRKSHSCSRSSRTFKSSSKKRWKDRLRFSRSFCRSRSPRSRSLASAGKRRQLPREPRDSPVQHSSRSDSQD